MLGVLPDLRNSGTVLLLVSLALSVATLTGMLSVGEPERQEAVAALPGADGVYRYPVVRMRGEEALNYWPICEADMAAIRDMEGVVAATAHGHAPGRHFAKYGRKHAQAHVEGVDEYLDSYRWHGLGERAKAELFFLGRRIEAAHVAGEARVCTVDHLTAEELGLITIDVPRPAVGLWQVSVDRVKVMAPDATVRIDGHPFKVIGFSETGVEIPATTFRSLFGDEFSLGVLVKHPRPAEEVDLSTRLEQAYLAAPELEARLQQIFQTEDRFLLDETGYRLDFRSHA
ncbi:MAG: hypothetical protein GTN78_19725, partial [Gemmatimonadales bacterium]|nr:hypothetical protein [Gemmatimonadales bacterium]